MTIDRRVLEARRDVKVKLPADLLLRLYYLKLAKSQTYSDVIETALNRYFEEIDLHAPSDENLGR